MKRVLICAMALSGCATPAPPSTSQDDFFAAISARCGRAFEGKLVTTDAADAGMVSARLVMDVRECSSAEIRIPFHVGDDRSRTWVLIRTDAGLRLKHDHRHEDGGEDALTQYGGDTAGAGTPARQEFPADKFSKDLFLREGRAVSVDNVWAMEIGAEIFAYELKRPNRHFRVEFDLAHPVGNPPPPWGAE
ncbi:MAG: hypothetical protein U5J99_06275 [Parvularculaceae bacterium]|nr:hypothetical protein [Parvularculaceae bacterium]